MVDRCNENWQGKNDVLAENLALVTPTTINHTGTDLGLNPGNHFCEKFTTQIINLTFSITFSIYMQLWLIFTLLLQQKEHI
jgi:hypothetical protein